MSKPKLKDGWAWRPCKDGQTGYLDSPTGHTTRNPVTPERAERIMETYTAMGVVFAADAADQAPPGLTGFYVRQDGDDRFEVRFAFEGETVFDNPEDARQACDEYRRIVIESDPIREDERELYRRALEAWGYQAQLGMVQEEAAEVIVAASKVLRHWTRDTAADLCEELGDLEIMIGQMRAWLGDAGVDLAKTKKLARLRRRLNDV